MLPASLPRLALAHSVRQTGCVLGEAAFYLVYHSNKIDLFHIIFRFLCLSAYSIMSGLAGLKIPFFRLVSFEVELVGENHGFYLEGEYAGVAEPVLDADGQEEHDGIRRIDFDAGSFFFDGKLGDPAATVVAPELGVVFFERFVREFIGDRIDAARRKESDAVGGYFHDSGRFPDLRDDELRNAVRFGLEQGFPLLRHGVARNIVPGIKHHGHDDAGERERNHEFNDRKSAAPKLFIAVVRTARVRNGYRFHEVLVINGN
jgi:hypothetical protein